MNNPFAPRKKKSRCVPVALCLIVIGGFTACASRSQFQKGYDRGASDTVKRQYWILQNLQKEKRQNSTSLRPKYYRFTIPPDPKSTVKTVPQQVAIPIYE